MANTDIPSTTSLYDLGMAILVLLLDRRPSFLGRLGADQIYIRNSLFTVLPLTAADRKTTNENRKDKSYYQNAIKNLSHNQDIDSPNYSQYPPIKGLDALRYTHTPKTAKGDGYFWIELDKVDWNQIKRWKTR